MIKVTLYTVCGDKVYSGFANKDTAIRFANDYIAKNGYCHFVIEAM